MCHPAAFLVAQTAMQVAGQRAETAAQVRMYQDQEKAALANQKISERRQEDMAEQYGREEKRLRDNMRLTAGQNAAEGGSAGLAQGGSLMDVLGASYSGYLQDKQALLHNQRNDTYSEFTRGWGYGEEARQARAGAANAKAAGRRAMVSTILGAASQYAGLKAGLAPAGQASKAAKGLRVPKPITDASDRLTSSWRAGGPFAQSKPWRKW